MPLQFVAQGPMQLPAVGGDSAVFTNFIARTALTSPTDDKYINAFKAFLNGMTTDGFFNFSTGATTIFDGLYIGANKNIATAQFNLVSSANPLTITGGAVITTDAGFFGGATPTNFDTGINASLGGFLYTLNDAHLAVFDATTGGSTGQPIGIVNPTGSSGTEHIHSNFSGSTYFRINSGSGGISATVSDTYGHRIGVRTTSTNTAGYVNGASVVTSSGDTTAALINGTFGVPSQQTGSVSTDTIAAFSLGASMTPTQASNYYARLYACLHAINGTLFP